MSIRKIRANSAHVDNEYIHVEQHSMQPLGALFGFGIGLIIALVAETDVMTGGIITLSCTFILAAFFPGKVVRDIPEVDVVEIKHYPNEDRVTVVVDDERSKRRQAVATSQKQLLP